MNAALKVGRTIRLLRPKMAVLRRSRRVFMLFCVGVSALIVLYFTDVFYLHGSSLVKEQLPIRTTKIQIRPTKTTIIRPPPESTSVPVCEKQAIVPAKVDIQTDELWYELFGPPPQGTADMDHPITYGYNESDNKSKLKVFVIPHSHVDPGWLKTVAQYQNSVDNMLNNMISYMPDHPNMTFTWMEIGFFEKWWRRLNEDKKEITKTLLKEGRFQITSGSWVMTDEASPYYWASIDNIIEGHQFLKRELGIIPNVMWSNDPFGYGPTVPYLFRLAGVDRAVLQRIHSTIKATFGRRHALDFLYRQFFDSTGQYDTQVHALPYVHYDIPNSCGPNSGICCLFDFRRITDWGCGGGMAEPITDENVAVKAAQLYDQYVQLSRIYRNNVLLVMLGDDFRYDVIREWSQQHDNYMRLMRYMDGRLDWNIEVRFGTFEKFFDAFNERATSKDITSTLNLPSLSGDFFPYNDVGDNYWTGYYTTRPFYKRQDRIVQAMIRSADIASSLVHFSNSRQKQSPAWFEQMREARRNLALFQHHDAITGTSKWPVVADYGKRLNEALLSAVDVTRMAISALIHDRELNWTRQMPHFNRSPDEISIKLETGRKTILWMFNSLPYTRTELVRFRVSTDDCLSVFDPEGALVQAQLNPIFNTIGIETNSEYELIFEAKLPPLATVYYTLSRTKESKGACAEYAKIFITGPKCDDLKFPKPFNAQRMPTSGGKQLIELENNAIKTYHNSETGLLEGIKSKTEKPKAIVWKGSMQFWHYSKTRSGAYLFEPSTPATRWPGTVSAVILVRGSVTDEIHSFMPCIRHKEYLRKVAPKPEPDVQLWMENDIDIRSEDNVELVMRIMNSDIVPRDDGFMTDSMGFQLLRRRYLADQPINRNYYPMSSQFILQTDDQRMTLLSGQPHGVTTPVPGGMEIMLDRKLSMDDSKGLGSDSLIRDNVPVSSVFRLILETGDFTASRALSLRSQRSLQNLLYPPTTFQQGEAEQAVQLTSYLPLQEDLPCDTLLLNIRPLDDKQTYLLLLHRTLAECSTSDESSCRTDSHENLFNLLSNSLGSPRARKCTLSGIEEDTKDMLLSDFSSSDLKPMEIKPICIY